MQYDCPVIDIGDRKGYWGYIDFISEREIGKGVAAVKGVDCIGRAFLSVKAEYVVDSQTWPTFSTFFQKYVNNKNIWQCFNYPGMALLKTDYMGDGYAIDAKQIAFLQDLLTRQKLDDAFELPLDVLDVPREVLDLPLDAFPLSLQLRSSI